MRATRGCLLVSNHGLVLALLAARPALTIRQMADSLGITERQINRIVRDLEGAEFLSVTRSNLGNSYAVNLDAPFLHPSLRNKSVRPLVDALAPFFREDGPGGESKS